MHEVEEQCKKLCLLIGQTVTFRLSDSTFRFYLNTFRFYFQILLE